MSKRPTYADLKKELADAEAMIKKMKNGKYIEITSERDSALLERDTALLGVRELEEAYIESEQNFRNAMDICPLGIRIVTLDGELLYANQAMLDICGFGSYEELKAIPRQELYTPESYAAHQERKERRKRGEFLTGEYEIAIRCPRGEVKNLEVFRRDIIWGGESQFMVMYQDVTERKRLEDALKKERKEYGRIINSSPIIIFYKDTSGKFIHVNKAFAEALDISEEAFIGKTVFDLYTADIARSMTDDDNEVFNTGLTKLNIVEKYMSARGLRWVQTDKIPIQDENKKIIGLVGFAQDITGRKQAEEALSKSELEKDAILSSMTEPVAYQDLQHRVLWANRAASESVGLVHEQLVGRFCYKIWQNRSEPCVGCPIIRARETGQPQEAEITTEDGRVWYVRGYPIKDSYGNVIGLVEITQDITERKKAEEALVAERRRLFDVLETVPVMICLLTPDHHIAFANRSFREKFGESHGRHCYEYCFGQTEPCTFCESYKVLETGKPHQWQVTTPDGKSVIDAYDFPFTNVDGTPMILEMDIDITESKKAEEALRASEERFRGFFEKETNYCYIISPDGIILDVNSAALNALGYTEEELIGQPLLTTVYAPESRDRTRELFLHWKEDGLIENEELTIITKEGERRSVLLNLSAMRDVAGKLLHSVSIQTDITERKKAEETHQTILKTAIDGFWMVDLEGKILEVNDSYCKMSGYTRDELLNMHISDLETIENQEDIRERIKRIMQNDSDRFETRHRRKDGEIIDVEISTNRLDISDGRISTFARDITERKKAEEEIKLSEEKYRSVVEVIPDGIVTLDTSGVITSMNKKAAEITGFSEEEIVGKHISKVPVISWKNVPRALKIFQSIIKGKGPAVVEVPCKKKDGTPRIGEFRVSLMKAAGKITGIQVMARDVTERNQAEEALRESEDKFFRAFRSSPDRIVITRLEDGTFIDVNDSYLRFTGYTRDEIIGKSTTELGSWVDPGHRTRIMQKLKKDGQVSGEEVQLHIKSGEIRTSLFSAELIDIKGERCMISVATDITERKLAEERISNLNRTLRSIRDINQLITREKDRDTMMKGVCNTLVESRSFNSAWIALLDDSRKLLGVTHSGFNSNFSPMPKALKRGELPQCIKKALDNGEVVITRDPRTTCTECPLYPDYTGVCGLAARLEYEGNVYGVLCASMPEAILSDADEVSLFEEVATDIAFALHDISLEAEHELMEQERLRNDKLESISTLAGGIAHDFNNLLTGIMGNIGLAKKYTASSEKASETLEEAEKAAMRARDLTQQLLTFARGGKPVKKTVDISRLIEESATFALRGSAARLELSLPDDLWPTEVDEGQINQVIHNMVINADESMPAGGTVNIRGMNSVPKEVSALPLPSGRYVRIDIHDTGTGISKAHLQRIFEPYFTTKKKGSGLGLSSAYSIIKNHGGYILAESTKNKGTTFHIYLPASGKAARMKSEPKQFKPAAIGGRVLVMDDDEVIRKMLINMLKLAGYEAETTTEGSETLEKYAQAMKEDKPFDVVIMDLTIPGGMGGKEAVSKLLKIDPGARVIVSSGYATDPIMSEYKKHGFSAVIAKPYSVKQLEETLHSLLKK